MTQPVRHCFQNIYGPQPPCPERDLPSSDRESYDHDALQLYVLIFKISDYLIALDSEQVLSLAIPAEIPTDMVTDMESVEIQNKISVARRRMEYALGEKLGKLRKPRLVTFRIEQAVDFIMIEEPVRFMKIELEDIYPMPAIINLVRGTNFLWGVFFSDNRPVFLLDLIKVQRGPNFP